MNFGPLGWGKTNRLAQMFKPDRHGESYRHVGSGPPVFLWAD
jgi:hypothetical protein